MSPTIMRKYAMYSDPHTARKHWGMLVRKERWAISWRGWLVIAAMVALTLYLTLLTVQPFLAVTERVSTHVLVVEGWVHNYAIRAAAHEFKTGGYERVFATGGPVAGNGGYVNDYQTSASVGADLLRQAGVASESVQMVPSRVSDRDRTYSSAVALRKWLRENNIRVDSFNIVTEDTHARRTRLLFEKVFGRHVRVGIIAVPDPDYDQRHWWRYSEGVQHVLSEGIAYLYARFFFSSAESPT